MVNPKTKQKKTPTTNEDFDMNELSDLSGEATVRQTRYTVPIIKFHGTKGKFFLLTQKKDGTLDSKELGDKIEGIILKIRRSYVAYEKRNNESYSFFTNEHNSYRDSVSLFERKKGAAKANLVYSNMLINELKESDPDIHLKLKQYLYLLLEHENQIVKLGVKGKSLSTLFEYYKEFGPKEHLFQFKTLMTCHPETNEGGLDYYVTDFKRGETVDLKTVEPFIRQVAESLNLQDKSYANMPKQDEKFEPAPDIEDKDIPIIEEKVVHPILEEKPVHPDENGKEIKVEDIPF
jgi:hypothetical protein